MSERITRLNAALEGRYTIDRELGEGGMATVYLARDLKHNRSVALKVLKPELAAVVGAERFLAEIKTTANLQHPHILPLFDSGEADKFLFYVMPYVTGETLRDRIDREKQLPIDEALRIATSVAQALDYAHRHAVIHRDVKPANILLQDGQPVVGDFGIALAVAEAGGGRLTETGLSLGSPYYMSPEQASADREPTAASDVYSLGCVLYEMLVGEPPYTGGSAQAVLAKILTTDAPTAASARASIPANVDAAIRRALEKLPADRFESAQDLVTALGDPAFRHGAGQEAPPPRATRTLLIGAVGGAALALLLGPVLFAPSAAPLVRFGPVTKVTFDVGLELAPAISPDGQEIAYVFAPTAVPGEGDSLFSSILVRSIVAGTPARVSVESAGAEAFPAWSPDAASLSFHSGDRLYRVPSRGGTPRPAVGTPARFGAWSPDGDALAYVGSEGGARGIFVRSDDGVERKITEADGDPYFLRWSPDGRWIAFVDANSQWITPGRTFGNVAPSRVVVVSTTGGNAVPVTTNEHLNASPAWLPDGRLLFVSSRGGVRDVYVVELERDGSPAADPVRVTAGLNPHTISVSADGRRLAYSLLNRTQNVYTVDIPTGGPVSAYDGTQVTVGQQVIEGMAVSPDGEWLAFDSDRSGNQDVYRQRLTGGEPLQLPVSTSAEFVRSWSADGNWIIGHGFNQGNRDLFMVDREGLEATYFSPDPAHERFPDVSPDGGRVAFTSDRVGYGPVFVIERDESGAWGNARQVSPAAAGLPRWSPDGTQLAYYTVAGVWLAPAAGGEPRMVFEDPNRDQGVEVLNVEWYADGSRLLIGRRFPDASAGLWSIPSTGGPLSELIRFDDPSRQPRSEMAVHDDQVYFTLGEFESDIWVMDLEWQ